MFIITDTGAGQEADVYGSPVPGNKEMADGIGEEENGEGIKLKIFHGM